jgi:hypothetical protein
MNSKSLVSAASFALALIGSGAAFAQEATSDAWTHAAMSSSRTQVQAELQQARKDGSIRATAAGYMTPFKPVAARADVRSGELDRIDAEAHAFVSPRGQVAPTVLAGK